MGYLANAGGGGSSKDLGYFVDLAALQAAYPVGAEGEFAILGTTDTFWVWDSDTSAWVDSGEIGMGDVIGPASAVDSNFVSFNTTTGKLIKDSGVNSSSFATSMALANYLPKAGGTMTGGLILAQGTTVLEPLKMVAGTNLTIPIAGVFEFDGTNLFFSI